MYSEWVVKSSRCLPFFVVEKDRPPVIPFFIEISGDPIVWENPSQLLHITFAECWDVLTIPVLNIVKCMESTVKTANKKAHTQKKISHFCEGKPTSLKR
jgi:hypothetical protein